MVALVLALLEQQEQAYEITQCLKSAGYRVYVLDSFEKAMQLLRCYSFDLIISDVHLENGGSVFDLLKWVKSQETFRQVPFVLISLEPTPLAKYLADGVRTSSRMLGASKYISMEKFDPVVFYNEIAELMPTNGIDVPVSTKDGE